MYTRIAYYTSTLKYYRLETKLHNPLSQSHQQQQHSSIVTICSFERGSFPTKWRHDCDRKSRLMAVRVMRGGWGVEGDLREEQQSQLERNQQSHLGVSLFEVDQIFRNLQTKGRCHEFWLICRMLRLKRFDNSLPAPESSLQLWSSEPTRELCSAFPPETCRRCLARDPSVERRLAAQGWKPWRPSNRQSMTSCWGRTCTHPDAVLPVQTGVWRGSREDNCPTMPPSSASIENTATTKTKTKN